MNTSTLSILPPDIIRIIIPMAEQPSQLRLISPTWNTLVFSSRISQPIDRADFDFGTTDELKIKMTLSKELLRYLNPDEWIKTGMDYANKHIISVESVRKDTLQDSTYPILMQMKELFMSSGHAKRVWIEGVEKRTFDIIRDCLGSVRIDRVTVRVPSGYDADFQCITEESAKINARHRVIT